MSLEIRLQDNLHLRATYFHYYRLVYDLLKAYANRHGSMRWYKKQMNNTHPVDMSWQRVHNWEGRRYSDHAHRRFQSV